MKLGRVPVQRKAAAADQHGLPTPQPEPKAMPPPTPVTRTDSEGNIEAVLAKKMQELKQMGDKAAIMPA